MNEYVYPRLSFSDAVARTQELRRIYAADGNEGLALSVRVSHPRANPVPTGGSIASDVIIKSVRLKVMDDLAGWMTYETLPRTAVADFDRALGVSLHSHLHIVPSDAAHDETWNFIGLMVFPDVTVRRFSSMHDDRMLGTERNALRRCWFRQEVLGSLMNGPSRPLGEDELVGLFERTALARNRNLVRRLAARVLDYDGPIARSEWARQLYVRVTYTTGPRLLDVMSDDALDDLIRQCEPMN